MNIHDAFKHAARKLAAGERQYTQLHKAHGIEPSQWELLTQDEYWTVEQHRQVSSILSSVVDVAMTIAGMPAIPLPGQYVAALIAAVVHPCNAFLAAIKAPDTFDAVAASGVMGTFEVKPMAREQLLSLVLLYSADYTPEPAPYRLPKALNEEIKEANKK